MIGATLFVDYQNMYRSARDAFGWNAEGAHFGNFRPELLAQQLARANHTLYVDSIRVYTGIHTPRGNAHQNAAMNRRMSAWIADGPDLTEVFPRPLAYRGRGNAREKGVDVELAIDMVSLALDEAYTTLILASADTDLIPAIDLIHRRNPGIRIVTLGYEASPGYQHDPPAPIDLSGGGAIRRLITKSEFETIVDRRNFNLSASDASGRIDSGRWKRVQDRTTR